MALENSSDDVMQGSPSGILRKALDQTGYAWAGLTWTVDMPEGVRMIAMPDLMAYCDTLTAGQVRASSRIPPTAGHAKDPAKKIKDALLSLARAAADAGFGFIGPAPPAGDGGAEGEVDGETEGRAEGDAEGEGETGGAGQDTSAPVVDTEGTFMARRQQKRADRREKLHRMVHGEPKVGAPNDGLPDSTYASDILRDMIADVGIPEDKYQYTIPLPGLSRTVKFTDLYDYCDTQPEEAVIEACTQPEAWSTDDHVTEMIGRLYPLAEAAARAGFGEAHQPLGEDGQPIPPEPGPFEVGKKYEAIGEKVGKEFEIASELGENIGKDISKKFETIGAGIGKKYESAGDKGKGVEKRAKGLTKKVESYGKTAGRDMERKVQRMNQRYETIGDKFQRFEAAVPPELTLPPEMPVPEAQVLVTKGGAVEFKKECRTCGKPFTTAFPTVVYCSADCQRLALRNPTGKRADQYPARRACEVCGKELPAGASKMARFCSDTCHDVYFSTHVREIAAEILQPRKCPKCSTLLSDPARQRCPVCGAGLTNIQ